MEKPVTIYLSIGENDPFGKKMIIEDVGNYDSEYNTTLRDICRILYLSSCRITNRLSEEIATRIGVTQFVVDAAIDNIIKEWILLDKETAYQKTYPQKIKAE